MKKLIFLPLIFALCICGCSNKNGNTSSVSITDDIKEDDTVIETSSNLAPVSFEPDVDFLYEGATLKVTIPNKDENGSGKISLFYEKDGNSSETELPYAEWMTTSYIVPANDYLYILIQGCFSNDWRTTYVLREDKKAAGVSMFQLIDELDGGLNDVSDIEGDTVSIYSRADIFGTYSTKIQYDLSTENYIDTYYEFVNEPDPGFWDDIEDEEQKEYLKQIYSEDGRSILTLTSDLAARTNERASDEHTLVPKGSQIYPVGYDPTQEYFYFEYDGNTLFVDYDPEEREGLYGYSIDDVNEENLFAILPYAG